MEAMVSKICSSSMLTVTGSIFLNCLQSKSWSFRCSMVIFQQLSYPIGHQQDDDEEGEEYDDEE